MLSLLSSPQHEVLARRGTGQPGQQKAGDAMIGRTVRTVVGVASLVGALSVAPAAADAPMNSNNCLGAAFSGLVPEETSEAPPTYGQTSRAQAAEQIRDDLLTGAAEALASCGTP